MINLASSFAYMLPLRFIMFNEFDYEEWLSLLAPLQVSVIILFLGVALTGISLLYLESIFTHGHQ